MTHRFARLTGVVAGVAALSAAAPALAQRAPLVTWADRAVTIRAENIDRRALLTEFARVTGVRIDAGIDRVPGRLSVDLEGEPLLTGLAQILTGLDYIVTVPDTADEASPAALHVWIRGRSGEAAVVTTTPEPDEDLDADADADDDAAETDVDGDDGDRSDDDEEQKPQHTERPSTPTGVSVPGMPTPAPKKQGSS